MSDLGLGDNERDSTIPKEKCLGSPALVGGVQRNEEKVKIRAVIARGIQDEEGATLQWCIGARQGIKFGRHKNREADAGNGSAPANVGKGRAHAMKFKILGGKRTRLTEAEKKRRGVAAGTASWWKTDENGAQKRGG